MTENDHAHGSILGCAGPADLGALGAALGSKFGGCPRSGKENWVQMGLLHVRRAHIEGCPWPDYGCEVH